MESFGGSQVTSRKWKTGKSGKKKQDARANFFFCSMGGRKQIMELRPSNAWSTKCRLIACMSAQIRSNLRDESIKPN
jgi:hypothetical protein